MKLMHSDHISPFGGLNFVIQEFDQLGVGKLLNQQLPKLPKQSEYNWNDLFYSFWSVFFCGGDCTEDLDYNFKSALNNMPQFKLPSPDRVLERMKQLSGLASFYEAPRGKKAHMFSHNDQLNRINIRLLKRLSTFNQKGNILDYDNTPIFTEKDDAKMTYCKQFGYTPGVGIMGNHVVYVENRNGNSDPQTLQQVTLQRMFDLLYAEDISIDKFRADSASYQLSTLDVISNNVTKYYVRTRMDQSLSRAIEQIDNWELVKDEEETIYRGDTIFTPFQRRAKQDKKQDLLKSHRLVVTKVKRADGQINMFTGEAFNYYGIITNDEAMTNEQIFNFYNQRGGSEREFDVLKNDFGWNNMPFSRLDQNTVFLIITAMCRNLYNHIITTFSKRYKSLSPVFRVKKFLFRFICIPAKWIRSSRMMKLRIYGSLPP